jgi:hypothetical protein
MSLNDRTLAELAQARFDLSPRESKALSEGHRRAVELAGEHLPDLVAGFRQYAQELLRDELQRISVQHFGVDWEPLLEYGAWDAIVSGAQRLTEFQVRRLTRLSQQAGGWYHYPTQAAGPVFVSLEIWADLYDKHVAYQSQIRRDTTR